MQRDPQETLKSYNLLLFVTTFCYCPRSGLQSLFSLTLAPTSPTPTLTLTLALLVKFLRHRIMLDLAIRLYLKNDKTFLFL